MGDSTNSKFAIRDLRNIPDCVLKGILQRESYARMFLDSVAMISFGVFDYLWSTYGDNVDMARLIVSRWLSPAQRALLLTQDVQPAVLEVFVRYNIPTLAELKALRYKTLSSYTSNLLYEYYDYDPTVADVLVPLLASDVRVRYIMRSDPKTFSDAEVLAAMNSYYEERGTRSLVERADGRSPFLQAPRDLIETRPHLVLEVVKNRDTRVQIAVAESRYVADPAVLEAVIRTSVDNFNTESAELLDRPVLEALAYNPVVTPPVRRIAQADLTVEGFALDTLGDKVVSFDFASIGGERLLWVLERTVGTNSNLNDPADQDWDFLVLAKNLQLPREFVRIILRKLGEDRTRRRLGAERTYEAHRTLRNRLGDSYDTLDDGELPRCLEPATAVRWAETPDGDAPYELDLDNNVESEFSGHCGSAKDARSLTPFLGFDPQTWLNFIQSLDVVPPETTVRKAAITAARLANAH